MKKPFKSSKVFIPLIALLSSVMCFSIGFGAWNMTGGVNVDLLGDINADNIEPILVPVQCIDNLSVDNFSYKEKFGFVVDETYTNATVISGQGDFNVDRAFTLINSLQQDGKINFGISIHSNSFSNYFVCSGINVMDGISNESGNLLYDSNIKGFVSTFNVENINNDRSSAEFISLIHFSFTISLSFTGSGASIGPSGNFPSFSGANEITITIMLGEYENE